MTLFWMYVKYESKDFFNDLDIDNDDRPNDRTKHVHIIYTFERGKFLNAKNGKLTQYVS